LIRKRIDHAAIRDGTSIEYLRNIIESGKTLKLREARPVNQGYSFMLQVTGLGKEWSFSLSKENIDDLPGTKA
jgi:hypothetical protein